MNANQNAMPEPATYTLAETAKILKISLGSAYRAAKREEIPVIRVGKLMLVPRAPFRRMLGLDA